MYERQKEDRKSRFCFRKLLGKNTRGVSVGQSSETEPNTKLVLVRREPLLYLEFNKPNKQNVYEINLFKKINFCQSQK